MSNIGIQQAGRSLQSIEERARLKEAAKRLGRVRDRFQRPIVDGDGVLVEEMPPGKLVWRVTQQTPATEPQLQGGIWLDVVATTRVLVMPMVPNEHVVLVLPRPEQPEDAGHEKPEGEGQEFKSGGTTPGGLHIP